MIKKRKVLRTQHIPPLLSFRILCGQRPQLLQDPILPQSILTHFISGNMMIWTG